MKIIGFILLILCFLIAIALSTHNHQLVNFHFLVAQTELRLSSLLGIVFGTGFILGWLFCGALYFKMRITNRSLRKKVNKQQAELNNLRIEPVKEK